MFFFLKAMVALSCVGMRVSTWHEVMKYRQYSNKTTMVDKITETVKSEFGHFPRNAKRDAKSKDWHFDQMLISIQLDRFFTAYGASRQRSDFPKQMRVRWDRIDWPNHMTNETAWLTAVDAHCPLPGHTPSNFVALHPLAQLLAGKHLNVSKYWFEYMWRISSNLNMDQINQNLNDKQNDMSRSYRHHEILGDSQNFFNPFV